MKSSYGKLFVVATPIGNLNDITFRAIEVLKMVDFICAEDTRRTTILLTHYDIKNKLISYHENNKFEKTGFIIQQLKLGKNIALVSDAGTPIISDPGDYLVSEAIKEKIDIVSIPGAVALINALVVSGISAHEFVFIGFLPNKKNEREQKLKKFLNEQKTMIFYIAEHNFIDVIDSFIKIFGESRNCSVSREMTKKFEETVRGTFLYIKNYFMENKTLGEFVLVVEGEKQIKNTMSFDEEMKMYIADGNDEKTAIKMIAKNRHIDKNEIYKIFKIGR